MRLEIDFTPEPANRQDVAEALSEAWGPIHNALRKGDTRGQLTVGYWRSDGAGLTDCEVKWGVLA